MSTKPTTAVCASYHGIAGGGSPPRQRDVEREEGEEDGPEDPERGARRWHGAQGTRADEQFKRWIALRSIHDSSRADSSAVSGFSVPDTFATTVLERSHLRPRWPAHPYVFFGMLGVLVSVRALLHQRRLPSPA